MHKRRDVPSEEIRAKHEQEEEDSNDVSYKDIRRGEEDAETMRRFLGRDSPWRIRKIKLTATPFPKKKLAVQNRRVNDETFFRKRFALKNTQKKANNKDAS